MAMWNPWRGCHRHSEGCRFCYIHKGDARRGRDTNDVHLTEQFYAPILRRRPVPTACGPGSWYICAFPQTFSWRTRTPGDPRAGI